MTQDMKARLLEMASELEAASRDTRRLAEDEKYDFLTDHGAVCLVAEILAFTLMKCIGRHNGSRRTFNEGLELSGILRDEILRTSHQSSE